MSILVSGGAGYVGSHACVELIEAGYDVIVADNLVNASREAVRRVEQITGKAIPFVQADLCDPASVEEIFEQFPSYNNNYGLRRGSQPRLFPSQSRSC